VASSPLLIVTERLVLRPPRAADAAAVLDLLNDPETIRWNPAAEVLDLASAEAWCVRAGLWAGGSWETGDHATWHAVALQDDEFAANVSVFEVDDDHRTAKVGYRVTAGCRGRGLGTEALRAVTDWAFANLNLARIQLEHALGNTASCTVAERAGYRLEGVLRSAYLDGAGVRHDEHVHGRLATDLPPK